MTPTDSNLFLFTCSCDLIPSKLHVEKTSTDDIILERISLYSPPILLYAVRDGVNVRKGTSVRKDTVITDY